MLPPLQPAHLANLLLLPPPSPQPTASAQATTARCAHPRNALAPPQDWNDGRIPYFTVPPSRGNAEFQQAEIVATWAKVGVMCLGQGAYKA